MINDCDHKCPKAVGFSYPGVVLHCSKCESDKKKKKYDVKQECINEFSSMEAMKEVEKKLWLEHYNQLCDKLLEVVREKCISCQTDQANQLGHELCLLASAEEQVNLYVLKRPIVDSIGMMSWNVDVRKYSRCPST